MLNYELGNITARKEGGGEAQAHGDGGAALQQRGHVPERREGSGAWSRGAALMHGHSGQAAPAANIDRPPPPGKTEGQGVVAAHSMARSRAFEPGSVLANRYEVREVLGHGHVGVVLRVFDYERGHDVAIKVIHAAHMANHEMMARFVRGATLAYDLDHPGIVKLYESHNWNDMLFYTMEFVQGKTLRHWLSERKRLDFGSAVRVLCLLADALDYAHKTTIHRDVSPDSIMVLADGSVRLLDFGLAKHEDRFLGLTMVGTNLGKLMYMAPEQELDASGVDHRADIYPLGIMLFEVLVGHTPQIGRRIRDFCPDLPPDIDVFLLKALARKPGDRFSTAREFREALLPLYGQYMAHKAGVPYKVVRPGPGTRLQALFRRFFRRN
jgi:serine/threonine protein kinase